MVKFRKNVPTQAEEVWVMMTPLILVAWGHHTNLWHHQKSNIV